MYTKWHNLMVSGIFAELVVSIMTYMQSRTSLPQQKWESDFYFTSNHHFNC
jgi:hypothetical protein